MQIELDNPKVKLKVALSDEESHALQLTMTLVDDLCHKMYREEFKEISIEGSLIRNSATLKEFSEISPVLNILLSAQDEEAEVYGIR